MLQLEVTVFLHECLSGWWAGILAQRVVCFKNMHVWKRLLDLFIAGIVQMCSNEPKSVKM